MLKELVHSATSSEPQTIDFTRKMGTPPSLSLEERQALAERVYADLMKAVHRIEAAKTQWENPSPEGNFEVIVSPLEAGENGNPFIELRVAKGEIEKHKGIQISFEDTKARVSEFIFQRSLHADIQDEPESMAHMYFGFLKKLSQANRFWLRRKSGKFLNGINLLILDKILNMAEKE